MLLLLVLIFGKIIEVLSDKFSVGVNEDFIQLEGKKKKGVFFLN